MAVRMILVDDSIETMEVMKMRYDLHPDVQVVGSATTATSGINLAAATAFDIISIDVQLREKNGLEVCSAIKENHPDAFVVMCSVEADDLIRQLARDAGADYFQPKPFGPDEVEDMLSVYYQKQRA